jgi:putative addiction module killer protein
MYDTFVVAMAWTVRQYVTPAGRRPYGEWLDTLPLQAQARIAARVTRFESGNLGDHQEVGGGVWEARLHFGPGYRLYFGKHRQQILLLLLGGSKKDQPRDIRRARAYWRDYLEAEHGSSE